MCCCACQLEARAGCYRSGSCLGAAHWACCWELAGGNKPSAHLSPCAGGRLPVWAQETCSVPACPPPAPSRAREGPACCRHQQVHPEALWCTAWGPAVAVAGSVGGKVGSGWPQAPRAGANHSAPRLECRGHTLGVLAGAGIT